MTFRWGILGAARIAQALIPAIRAAGGEVVMVGAREPQSARVQEFLSEWQVPQTGHYQDVINTDLDAIYNPLPNDLHLPWSEAAMRAGKHVLIEKPLTLNAAQAAQLEGVATETGRVLLEAFAYRFAPQHEAVLDIARSGILGELKMYRGAFGFPLTKPDDFRWTASMGGGALYDVGCYTVNLMRLLLGEPESVSAHARWTEGGPEQGVDVALSGVLDYSQRGALASIDCGFDWLPGGMMGRAQLIGSHGELELEQAYASHTDAFQLTVNGEQRPIAPGNGYTGMVRHFQRAAQGQETLRYPPSEAVAQARVLDALLLSAREGRTVQL
jgi:D-xylose 1-dehydrogenase (NADP+, D-xylono-1,5-lactone-forming)